MFKQLSSSPCDAFILNCSNISNSYSTMISRDPDKVAFAPAMSRSMSDENIKVDEGIGPIETSMDVYARFSPLVEGPSFLPIHVEIMLHNEVHDIPSRYEFVKETACVNDLKEKDVKGCECLYRFDFLPQKPKDPSTIQSLLTFRGVPGKVRFRTLQHCFENDMELPSNISQSSEYLEQTVSFVSKSKIEGLLRRQNNGEKKSNMSLTVPIGRISFQKECTDSKTVSKLPNSISPFLHDFAGTELNLLSSNCYTFAWSLLQTISISLN